MHIQAPRMFSFYLPTTVLSLLYHLWDSRHDHLNSLDMIILNSSLKEGSSNCCQQKQGPDWAIKCGDQEATFQRDSCELYMLPSLQSCTLISLCLDCLSPSYVMCLEHQLLPGQSQVCLLCFNGHQYNPSSWPCSLNSKCLSPLLRCEFLEGRDHLSIFGA